MSQTTAKEKLLELASRMVSESTHEDARGFDTRAWLDRWLETENPALGGRTPSALLDSPSGVDTVYRLLAALESGAYQ